MPGQSTHTGGTGPPLVLVHGGGGTWRQWALKDRVLPRRPYGDRVIAAVPGAEVVDLPDVGHGSMADDPALVARTIRAFIAAQNTGASA